jgi:DNA-binding CsgD family transcriptional regulator/tetratricopeptide (TPR) repeat protein
MWGGFPVVLLEREEQLVLMEGALARARGGRGHSVIVGGEAGIGKTSLVETFVRSQERGVRVLWGACEALATPRPLGPLYDIAHEIGGKLLEALDGDRPPHHLFQTFIDELRAQEGATVVVVEDAHWADDASADFLKFVARRIARYPALLAVTFREEEVSAAHPLIRAITDVPADHLSRIRLRGLSAGAIERLATAHGRTISNLHEITDGNPFLATELLRGHDDEVPTSLRDTMLARLQRLTPGALELAELVSVVPGSTERGLLERAVAANTEPLQECVDRRMLLADCESVRYRHELARRVVEGSLPEVRRRALHARVIVALAGNATDAKALSRLVHHADAARDAASVLRYAPLAGEEAARRGAHRQGAAFYRTALRYADTLSPHERAMLLERLASESRLSGRGSEALDANSRAFEIWCREGDTCAQGTNRRTRFEMLHISVFRRGEPEFVELPGMAVRLLEPHGASGELAKAYMSLAFVLSMSGQLGEAQAWHDRAVATAEASADQAALSYILLQGELRKHAFFGEPDFETSERALRIALEDGDDQRAAHAYFCLAMFATNSWRLAEAERVIAAGLRFTEERDLDGPRLQLLAFRGRFELLRGDWEAAHAAATEVLSSADPPGIAEVNASTALGACYARRGDSRASAILERALEVATTSIVTRISTVITLSRLAELHWLEGDGRKMLDSAQRLGEVSSFMQGHPWIRGQAAFWRWRLDGMVIDIHVLAPPYAMQLAGDWAGAAAAWAELGCPYERAMALVDGDTSARREAFAILDRLGATATIRRCREMLAARGVTNIPRGPRPTTRSNPMGLTVREIEVLALLAQGLHNDEIGGRLHRSAKTVARHVSAILAKLGAGTRRDAIDIARTKGMLGSTR